MSKKHPPGHTPGHPGHDNGKGHHDHGNGKGKGHQHCVPCVEGGTLIEALLQEDLNIDRPIHEGRPTLANRLQRGDYIRTPDGFEKIEHVTKQVFTRQQVANSPGTLLPFRVATPLSPLRNHGRILLSRHHRVLVNAPGYPEKALISALHLSRCKPELCEQKTHWGGEIEWVNIWCAKHTLMLAEGVWIETGYLGGDQAQTMLGDEWEQVKHLAPHHKPYRSFITEF